MRCYHEYIPLKILCLFFQFTNHTSGPPLYIRCLRNVNHFTNCILGGGPNRYCVVLFSNYQAKYLRKNSINLSCITSRIPYLQKVIIYYYRLLFHNFDSRAFAVISSQITNKQTYRMFKSLII